MSVWKMLNIPHIQIKYYCILDKQNKGVFFFPKRCLSSVAEGVGEWTLRLLLGVQIKAVLYKLNLPLFRQSYNYTNPLNSSTSENNPEIPNAVMYLAT